MIDFRKARYIISAPSLDYRPKDKLPELVFVGRSNVGKSSLINALTGQKLAYSSKRAGKTRYLNYFLIDEAFYLVDSPGYGYTHYGSKEDDAFGKMMERYFENPALVGCVFLLDCRLEPNADDLLLLSYLQKESIPTLVVFSKADKANQSEKQKALSRPYGDERILFSQEDNPALLRKKVAGMLKLS